ncbi:MAG: YggS family pyridoxal phosphate-dependent enzyme [Alphaproteobacteria bacterium]
MRVILASGSPRRRELLARIAWPYEVRPADVDETRRPGEDPEAYVRRLADEKALAVATDARDAAVLAADTSVVVDGDVLGKPVDDADAARMLARLAGREHVVLTGLAWATGGQVRARECTTSRVRFRALSEREIEAYVATGEPRDKAGAYGIQAGASAFVTGVTGSLTGVIGLPLEETERAARRVGVPEPAAPLPPDAIAARWRALAAEVAGLAVGCGRQASDVGVIAVTKGHASGAVVAALAAGARDVGENYVQEAHAKRDAVEAAHADAVAAGEETVADAASARWHLIGPLQRNKAAVAARTFDLVHTLSRPDVARALVSRAGHPVRGLLQVNVTRDPAKSGVAPEDAAAALRELSAVEGLSIEGLMTIGPMDEDAGACRAAFEETRALLDALRRVGYERLRELSMGMSGDYEQAIAAGATLLRIGTAVFGPRPPRETQG